MVALDQAVADNTVDTWVAFLKRAETPVLKQTARDIDALREDEDNTSTRDIANVVLNDPMMVFKVLSYAQQNKGRQQLQDLLQVEQAVLMMGTSRFFNAIPAEPIVEDFLKQDVKSLMHLMKLIVRAHKASRFAAEFAAHLKDLKAEEVRIATLLHDLAEMLMWCFNAERMKEIARAQEADKHLRSATIQNAVLGFQLHDLQKKMVETFNFPPLLKQLMDDEHADNARVKNVVIAVNLARHASHGWDDAALPDDFQAVADLLHVDVSRAAHIINKHK